jgi:hypothetical protein
MDDDLNFEHFNLAQLALKFLWGGAKSCPGAKARLAPRPVEPPLAVTCDKLSKLTNVLTFPTGGTLLRKYIATDLTSVRRNTVPVKTFQTGSI